MKAPIQVGIDVGGTFTDAIAFNPLSGAILMAFKVPSTPDDPADAVLLALERIQQQFSLEGALACHGTTIGTNTLIQRKGAKVGLVATDGFTDVIELRRQNRPTLYHLDVRVSEPLVPHERRFGVVERMDPKGNVVTPIEGFETLVEQIKSQGCDAIAISLLHSYRNSSHELFLEERFKKEFPGVFVTSSHDVCPEFREYERTSTTVVNAYIGPAVKQYIKRLGKEVQSMGISALMVVKSNGGLTSPKNAQKYPAHLIESGPAAGMIATQAYARVAKRPNIIAFDMGGTTAKAGVLYNYEPRVTDEFRADSLEGGRDVGGYPVRSAVLDLIEVGAGGGSIAWIDLGGVPKVGPQSAGAEPGPACYGRGGELPTVTDAHAVIGTLTTETFEGTGVKFSKEKALRAIENHIAKPMNWSIAKAAHAIIDIAISNMTEMVRLATARRGYDPRQFSILASGGAGPLHAAEIGIEVGAKDIIIPPFPGIFSALGASLGEIRHDLSLTLLSSLSELSLLEITEGFKSLGKRMETLISTEPVENPNVVLQRFADLRFVGQLSELRIPLGCDDEDLNGIEEIEKKFRAAYVKEFGFDLQDAQVELVNLHLSAVLSLGTEPSRFFNRSERSKNPKPYQHRDYVSRTGEITQVAVYRTEECFGAYLQGPCLLDHSGSTVWVPKNTKARVQLDGGVVLEFDKGEGI